MTNVLAEGGDIKANFFYLARLIDDYEQTRATSSPSTQPSAKLQAAITASMHRALASGSPFAGYMFGSYYTALHGQGAAGVASAVGLTWATSMGDSRPVFTTRAVAMGFPGVSGVRAAEVYFDMFAAAARVNPYFLNARRDQGDLFIPLQ